MKKYILTILFLIFTSCGNKKSEDRNTPDNKDKNVEYIVFTDMRDDPDDEQSLRRLMLYPEVTPSMIIVQNGVESFKKAKSAIFEYEKDYSKLKIHDDRYKPAAYWDSILYSSGNDSVRSDFKDIRLNMLDNSLSLLEKTMHLSDSIYEIWLWSPATGLAHILHKRPALAKKIRIVSIGAWNKEQDKSAHDYLWSIRGELRGWVNLNTQFRAMYCDFPKNKSFVSNTIKNYGNLGAGYYNVSKNIHKAPYTMKEGDTPTFLFSYKCSWENPNDPNCWAGKFNVNDKNYPHIWSDYKDSSKDICGYKGTATMKVHRNDIQQSFINRLSRLQ